MRKVEASSEPALAVMSALPAAMPVARPWLTVAMLLSEEPQLTDVVID